MRRLLLLFVAALLATTPAHAGMLLLGVGAYAAPPPPPSYTGPGDVISGAVVWYGMRAYSAAKRGTKAVNVCLPLDVTCGDLNTDASTGALTITTIGGTACNNSTTICTVKIFYNQGSGGGTNDLSQATIGNRPTFQINCIGTLPCAKFVSASSQSMTGTISTQAQPLSFSVVALNNLSNTIGQRIFSPYAGGAQPLLYWQALTQVTLYVNGGFGTVNGGAGGNYAINAGLNNGATSGFLQVNGTNATASYSSGGTSTVLAIGADAGGGSYADFGFGEGGMWPSFFATTPTNNIETNERTYWGF